jgi:crossover junction endodeoxyribonuclease RuvC
MRFASGSEAERRWRGELRIENCELRNAREGRAFSIFNFQFSIHNHRVRIMGIDPGSVTTGFGVIDYVKGKLTLVDQGAIATRRGAELPERLSVIHDGVRDVIAHTQPLAIAVETPFAGKNVNSLIQLAHARGVILLAARAAALEVFEYAPRSVKSAVVGYGGAEKEQVAKMVRMLLPACGTMKMSADATDALAIAICHAHTSGTAARLKIRA